MSGDRLELVRTFVNTFDTETGAEDLADPEALIAWLAGRGLVADGSRAGRADLERARTLRESLRDLLVENAGGPPAPKARRVLDSQAQRSRVTLGFGDDGPRHEPLATGVDRGLGSIVAAVAETMADGSWPRLRACLAEDCRWAFVDRSRNASRHWCDMRICGNRSKARTFRARHAR